jgi:tetratricopeptide (TPR) repeat protein
MRAHLIAQLATSPRDLDYVEHFQTLSVVNLEIRRHGPSAERLLRKAILEMDLGNYGASLAAALDAVALDPVSPETHHQVAMAYLLSSLARAGFVPVGPGTAVHELPSATAVELMGKSMEAFRKVLRLNPNDQETQEDLQALESVVGAAKDDAALLARLSETLN